MGNPITHPLLLLTTELCARCSLTQKANFRNPYCPEKSRSLKRGRRSALIANRSRHGGIGGIALDVGGPSCVQGAAQRAPVAHLMQTALAVSAELLLAWAQLLLCIRGSAVSIVWQRIAAGYVSWIISTIRLMPLPLLVMAVEALNYNTLSGSVSCSHTPYMVGAQGFSPV